MKLLFVLLIFLTVRNVYSIKKLNIGIFIEADCIYSKQFITNQFRPAYRGIKDRVEVDFFTFGKSESFIGVDGEVKFRCQHGKEECRKNKLQTCGLHMLSEKDLQADFISCTMGFSKSYLECADIVNLNYQDINNCAEGAQGTQLQLQMENASSIVKSSGHVPTITFDFKYDVKIFFEALNDFYGTVEAELAKKI